VTSHFMYANCERLLDRILHGPHVKQWRSNPVDRPVRTSRLPHSGGS